MKKVLYGVALALFASVSVGSLQSCKDDVNDLTTQTSYDLSKLKKDLMDADQELQRQITANRNDINANKDAIDKLLQSLNDYATIKYVDGKVKDLQSADEALQNQINGALSRITTLETKIEGIETNKNAIEELKGKVEAQQAAIDLINAELPKIAERLTNTENNVAELQAQFTALGASVDELWVELQSVREETGQLAGIIQTLIDQYDALEAQLGEAIGRLDNLITSIIVQGTDSPVFGNFSLPLGIQSNVLFNWFGYNDVEAYKFPNAGAEYNYYDGAPVLTAAELAALKPELKDVKKGAFGDVNLGKLYMTINPVGHEFDETAFSLETTAANAFPATLNVKKSSDEMYFGYTRTTVEGNGFYEADVIVKEGDIAKAKIEIEDGLKAAGKAALEDPSKRTAVELLKAVYGQLNGMLPAYAVRYDWTVNNTPYSVLSNYAVAATTAKPLSYSFLYGKGSSKKLHTFGHIDNLILKLKDEGKLQFKFDPIKINGATITIKSLEINPDVTVSGGKLVITIPAIDVVMENGATGQTKPTEITVEGEDLDSVYAAIENGIKDALSEVTGELNDWTDDMQAEINDSLNSILSDVESQINKMMDSINGQINDMLGDLGDQFQPYFDRLNKLVDLYNKVANKINNFLADPNHYLQVAMFYNQASSNIGILSNKLTDPTIFKRGNGNVGLYASSYTGEILAPAYMKYVAVTNVYNASDKKLAANSAAERDAVNKAVETFNTVMPGNTIRYAIPAASLKAGLIYEIVYQGVDYSGRTSTQKFYIQVK